MLELEQSSLYPNYTKNKLNLNNRVLTNSQVQAVKCDKIMSDKIKSEKLLK